MRPIRLIFGLIVLIGGLATGNNPAKAQSPSWVVAESPVCTGLNAVWGRNFNDLWAVGDNNTVLNYDGTSWKVDVSPGGANLVDIFGDGDGTRYLLDSNGQGWLRLPGNNRWQSVPLPNTFRARTVWSNPDSTQVFFAGSGKRQGSRPPVIYNLADRSEQSIGLQVESWGEQTIDIFHIWGLPNRGKGNPFVFAVGEETVRDTENKSRDYRRTFIARFDGGEWRIKHKVLNPDWVFNAVGGFDKDNLWAVAQQLSLDRTQDRYFFRGTNGGSSWSSFDSKNVYDNGDPTIRPSLTDLWSPAANAAFALDPRTGGPNTGSLFEYRGGQLWSHNKVDDKFRPKGIWGSDGDNIFAVGNDGLIYRWGQNLTPAARPTPCTVTVNLQANGSEGPVSVPIDTAVTLSWTSVNADSCSAIASPPDGNWNGQIPVTGSKLSSKLRRRTTFSLTCTGKVGPPVSDAVVVTLTFETFFTLELGPKLILNPLEFKFGGNFYKITPPDTIKCQPAGSVDCARYVVELELINPRADGQTQDEFYQITVANFKKGRGVALTFPPGNLIAEAIGRAYAYTPPPSFNFLPHRRPKTPYGWRVTFKEPVSAADINNLVTYLLDKGNTAQAQLSSDDCANNSQSSSLCLTTRAVLRVPERTNNNLGEVIVHTKQRIPLDKIQIEGSVAGGGQLDKFAVSRGALVLGGDIKSGVIGRTVPGYVVGSKLEWNSRPDNDLNNKLQAIRERGEKNGAKFDFNVFPVPNASGRTWNLNSTSNSDPAVQSVNSSSSPPEGKLWYRDKANPLTIGDGLGPINFTGSGTIVLKSDLVIADKISCAVGSRLAIITTGSIQFRTSKVGCGAFISLKSSIFLDSPQFRPNSGELKVILAAREDINLPDPTQLVNTYHIKYDSTLAENPTILLREILRLLLDLAG